MSRGVPIRMKCPRCRRGQFGHGRIGLGVRPTGQLETKLTRTHNRGHHGGAPSFYGHRGQVECLDCGHVWYSTHPDSGRSDATREERVQDAVEQTQREWHPVLKALADR